MSGFQKTVEELRRAFDESFAVPAGAPLTAVEEFLAVRVAGRPFLIRATEITRLEARRQVVPLPASGPDLLGLSAIQGRLVPVFSLADLVGLPSRPSQGAWIAVCGREEPLGLAFDALEGYWRVPSTDVFAVAGEQAVRMLEDVRHVVPIPSILLSIRRRASDPRPSTKEP